MYLFIIHSSDLSAIWLYRNLTQQGIQSIELVTIDQIINNRNLTISLDSGKASFILDLFDGRTINSKDVSGFINRVQYFPFPMKEMFSLKDSDYILCEMHAIYTFFLNSLENCVLNRVTTAGLNGRMREKEEWLILASKAGLNTPVMMHNNNGINLSYTDSIFNELLDVLVYNGQCFLSNGNIPDEIEKKCCEFQIQSQERLLGIQLGQKEDELFFINANTYPDFQIGGQNFINELKKDLENGFTLRHSR